MSVYVDSMNAKFGRMKMSHMIADDHEELMRMAFHLGIAHSYIQKEGTPQEHFDVSKSKRKEAIALGAIQIGFRELVEKIEAKRTKMSLSSSSSTVDF